MIVLKLNIIVITDNSSYGLGAGFEPNYNSLYITHIV